MSTRKNKAFTFVELIVSITIISLMSVFAIGGLMGFVEEQALTSEVTRFETMLESLDRQVKNKELYDYELLFSKNKSYYELRKNTVGQKQKIEIGADGKITCKEIETDAICAFEDIIIFEKDNNGNYSENFEKKTIDSTKYFVENTSTLEKYYFVSDNYLGKDIEITVATEDLSAPKEIFTANSLKFQEKLYLKIFENDKLLVAGTYKDGKIITNNKDGTSEELEIKIDKEKNNYLIESYFQTLGKTTRLADREIRHFDEEKTITLSDILVDGNSKNDLTVTNILGKREPSTFSLIFEKLDRDFRLDFN